MTIEIDGRSYPVGRDSIIPGDIPVDGTDYAIGYGNGKESQWPQNGWDRFPKAVKVVVDVDGSQPQNDVLDVEKGDVGYTAEALARWVSEGLALYKVGKKRALPTLYCDRSGLTPMFNFLNSRGFHIKDHFLLWIATLDGTQKVDDMTGVVAVQYEGEQQTGGHYDQSIIWDPTWLKAKGTQEPEPVATPEPGAGAAPAPVPTSGFLVWYDTEVKGLRVQSVQSGDQKTWSELD